MIIELAWISGVFQLSGGAGLNEKRESTNKAMPPKERHPDEIAIQPWINPKLVSGFRRNDVLVGTH
jgi:hypothetical protein